MMRNNFPVTSKSKSKSKFLAHQKKLALKFTFTRHSNTEKRAHTLFQILKKFTYGLKIIKQYKHQKCQHNKGSLR